MIGAIPTLLIFCGAPLLIWWLRRTRNRVGSALKVVSRTALTRNGVVAVIETEGRRYLVGATDHGISLLSALESADTSQTDSQDITDDVMPVIVPSSLKGPGTSPIEALRAMTVRKPVGARTSRGHHHP
jgi:flagellar biogenesis protein FliO